MMTFPKCQQRSHYCKQILITSQEREEPTPIIPQQQKRKISENETSEDAQVILRQKPSNWKEMTPQQKKAWSNNKQKQKHATK